MYTQSAQNMVLVVCSARQLRCWRVQRDSYISRSCTDELSGLQARAYIGVSPCATVARIMPVGLHVLRAPSSPPVATAVPLRFQRTQTTQPSCAASVIFSTLPEYDISLKRPSEQAAASALVVSCAGACKAVIEKHALPLFSV